MIISGRRTDARDPQRCEHCAEFVLPEDHYCEACGYRLRANEPSGEADEGTGDSTHRVRGHSAADD